MQFPIIPTKCATRVLRGRDPFKDDPDEAKPTDGEIASQTFVDCTVHGPWAARAPARPFRRTACGRRHVFSFWLQRFAGVRVGVDDKSSFLHPSPTLRMIYGQSQLGKNI